ncbi:MAG: sugar phosphate isomerase/epimerase family protein [Chloroherpetonaceae bacterium]|nr:sugar phosphate isomerase/epimerase [Chthonomonadaceae bacterium]MDW8207080.1 sugar phosphate isomerase/epimerase family protein [Chloroherpetonaceae bacterium]
MTRRELIGAVVTGAAATVMPSVGGAQRPGAEKPRFRLGTVTYNIARDWDLPTLIAHCRASGFQGVELRTTHRHGVEPDISKEHRREVRQHFADAGVTLWGLGTVCEFHSPDAAQVAQNVEACRRWCALAADVGATGVKVRPNALPPGEPVEKTVERIAQALRICGQAARDHGVEIWLEVHGTGTAHPPVIRDILAQCAHPQVGVCWNSNPQDVLDGSVRTYFDLLRPYLKSCHINDLWNDRYPYRELFALLHATGYDRFTLCEVGRSICPESGVPFMQCYRGLWQELQRIPAV